MGYSREVFEGANKKIQFLKKAAILENEKRKMVIYQRFPKLKEIEILLSKTAIKAAKAVLNGSDTKTQLEKLSQENLKLQNQLNEILTKANLPLNYLDIKYSCDKCKDEGFIDGKMCNCFKNYLKQEAYAQLNKLSPLELSTFESFDLGYFSSDVTVNGVLPRTKMEKIFNRCKTYAQEFSLKSENLFMQGSTGLGKTHLSLSIANLVINKGYNVIYVSTPNIVSKLEKERFGSYNTSEQSDMHLINCDLLILDDLGTEFQTSFSNASIYNIINSRIMYNRPTIINTNLSFKEIQNSYSERLVSRIMGNYLRMLFVGSDIRALSSEKQIKS